MNRDNIDIHEVKELRLKTLVYFGCGAIKKNFRHCSAAQETELEQDFGRYRPWRVQGDRRLGLCAQGFC